MDRLFGAIGRQLLPWIGRPGACHPRAMGDRPIRSVARQTLHYLARPHSSIPTGPIDGRAAWRASEHADPSAWTRVLSEAELRSIEGELRVERGARKERLVPLAALASEAQGWRDVLMRGRGFLRIRGVPVERWALGDTERFFASLGGLLGVPGAQNDEGHLLGHVRDERLGPDVVVRQYKTSERIAFHCDAADVVGLLCVRPAAEGGVSRIVSSVAILARMLAEDPALAAVFFEPFHLDTRGDGGLNAVPIQPATHHDGRLRLFYHSGYFRSASRYPDVPELSERQRRALDRFDALADSPEYALEMVLEPGDIQLLSNHTIAHSRTAYRDHPELEERRHLLRLWLSIEEPRPLGERLRRWRAGAKLAGSLVSGRLRARLS